MKSLIDQCLTCCSTGFVVRRGHVIRRWMLNVDGFVQKLNKQTPSTTDDDSPSFIQFEPNPSDGEPRRPLFNIQRVSKRYIHFVANVNMNV